MDAARTCLVTGAAGFIGSHLSERLLHQGLRVVGIDCFTPYYPRERKEANLRALLPCSNFEFIEGDLRALDLPALLPSRGIDSIFHIAGQAGVRPSWGSHFDDYIQHNILATQLLLEAVKGYPLHRLVYASSSSVYGDAERLPTDEDVLPHPTSPYGVTKLAAEHLMFLYAKQYGVPAIALRYFTVYGPRQRPDMAFHLFIAALYQNRPILLLGDGRQTRDFTFVGDIVAANLLALRAPERAVGRVYNIGGGSRVSLSDAIGVLERVSGRTAQIEYRPSAAGDMRHTAADITRAHDDLGYTPSVPLEEGLRQEVEWYKTAML